MYMLNQSERKPGKGKKLSPSQNLHIYTITLSMYMLNQSERKPGQGEKIKSLVRTYTYIQ